MKEIDFLRDKLKELLYRNRMLEDEVREIEKLKANNDIAIYNFARKIKKIEEGK